MKRPLSLFTVVLVFGVILLYKTETEIPFIRKRLSSSYVFFQEHFENREVMTFSGKVVKIEMKEEGWNLIISVDRNAYIRVRLDSDIRPLYGQMIRVEGKTYLFSKATNPGQFDLKEYYDHLHIYGGLKTEEFSVISGKYDRLKENIFRIRLYFRKIIERYVPEEDRGVFEVLTTGYKGNLDEEMKQDFSDFGLTFLISFSGLHITLMGNAIYRFVRKYAGKRTGFITGIIFIILLYFLSAESSSVFRACIIFILRVLAPLTKRKYDYINASSAAFVLLIFQNPEIVFLSGFQFAFSSYLCIGYFIPALKEYVSVKSSWFNRLSFIICFQIVFLPVKLYWYYKTSLFSFLSVSLSVLMLPFILFSAFSGVMSTYFSIKVGAFIFGTGHMILKILQKIISVMKSVPYMIIVNGRPSDFRILIYILICFFFYLLIRIPVKLKKYQKEEDEKRVSLKRPLILSALLISVYIFGILILRHEPVGKNEVRITALDIGQGDCTVIETDNRVYISDCGSSSVKDIGKDILIPFLYYQGHSKVDMVFLSHGDEDHVSAIETLFNTMPVKQVFLPQHKYVNEEFSEILSLAKEVKIPVNYLYEKEVLTDGDSQFSILWPVKDMDTEGNEGSMVFCLKHKSFSGIFPGDISSETEERIHWPENVTYLKVAHHGSSFSSSEEFLKRIKADVASVSAGRKNSYNHPSIETVERIISSGTELFCTKESGAVTFLFGKENCKVTTYLNQKDSLAEDGRK